MGIYPCIEATQKVNILRICPYITYIQDVSNIMTDDYTHTHTLYLISMSTCKLIQSKIMWKFHLFCAMGPIWMECAYQVY